MVLTSILKKPMSNLLKDITQSPRVKFDLPTESRSIINYLQEDDIASGSTFASKLHSVVKVINTPETDESLLLSWITELKDNILFLGKEKERITFALLNLKWYSKEKKFVAVYQEFILNLVTAHSSYLRIIMSIIVRLFLTVSVDNEDPSAEEIVYLENIHSLIKKITELVPLSQHPLCVLLSEKFPYFKVSSNVILRYVQNLLSVSSYLPTKRSTILECIIEKIIQLDVNCSRFEIEDYEANKEDMLEQTMELDTSAVKSTNDMALPIAHTQDLLMNCMFKYIQSTCFPEGGDLNWDSTKKLYKELLTSFDKLILLTHGSCHVQYLLFYICSFKQDLCDGFLDYLWKKVQNPNVAPVFRQIASFYIGSLLSRAKYINISTVTACFDLMCNWLHRYIDAHTTAELGVHGTFHAVCQTVFYVFAFRNKELLEIKNGFNYLQSLNFDRIVTCRLNPLQFCDRTIVQNFASIARHHQIAYVYPVIERNNRNLLYAFSDSNSGSIAGALVQTFFPFDPYLLKRSKHWIEAQYRIYSHTQKDEDSVEMEEDEPCHNDDMFTYSMSPGFKKSLILKHVHR